MLTAIDGKTLLVSHRFVYGLRLIINKRGIVVNGQKLNIVNVATITGITTFSCNTEAVVCQSSLPTLLSGKVLKINSKVERRDNWVTVKLHNAVALVQLFIATTVSVPTFLTLTVISKENSIYVQENQSISAFKQANAGDIDVICGLADIIEVKVHIFI